VVIRQRTIIAICLGYLYNFSHINNVVYQLPKIGPNLAAEKLKGEIEDETDHKAIGIVSCISGCPCGLRWKQ
jgi:hypothetical protein